MSSLSSKRSGASSFVRAAASSTASGRPSTRLQIDSTVVSGTSSRPIARARSTKRAVASRSESGSNRYSRSPETRSGARLVTRIRKPAAALRTLLTAGAASSRCSKLSSSTSSSLRRRNPRRSSRAPIACATSEESSSGSDRPASGTQKTPSLMLPTSSAATCNARRVLPVPPAPVSVSSRVPFESSETSSSSSSSRPTSALDAIGRFVASSVRIGGNSAPPS